MRRANSVIACRRLMCKHCLGEYTASLAYIKKDLNVLDTVDLLNKLPVTRDYKNRKTSAHVLVLKEDVAGLYDTSWQLFLEGAGARKTQMSSPHFPDSIFHNYRH